MKKLAFTVAAIALVIAGTTGTGRAAEDSATLNGEYVWENGNATGDLEAVFTPSGEGEWNVSFNFTFRNKPHTYSGTAKGNLAEGALQGTVLNENKKRTFMFEGTFEDGVFIGTHKELDGEKSFSTGTLTLR